MPRQDVPYGGALCRLKERIAEIWDELGKKLHSINGVEGDAAGDVKIVSGDAAITITDSPVGHYVEIGLDHGNLPSALVSSVNGQTGAVVLDASDINVIGGSDVATDLGNLDADLQQAQTDIATEALTRANADSALQGNINAALATIPGEVSSQIASNATIAQLVTADGQNVKLTGAQTINNVKTFISSPIVPTPPSGSTDGSAANTNWISQTGDGAPNNLVHRFGNETIYQNKTYADHVLALESVQNVPAVMPRAIGTGWIKLYESIDTNHANAILAMLPRRATSNPGFGILAVGGHNNGTVICKWMSKDLVNANYLDKVMVTIETDVITVWGANISATDNVNMRIMADVFNGSYMTTYTGFKAATDTAIYTMTTDGGGNIIGYTDSDSVVHTFVSYEVSS